MSDSCVTVGDAGLGSKVANELACKFVRVDNRVFPDGEIAPRILVESTEEINNRNVVAVFQKGAEEPVNNYVLRSFLTLSTLKRYEARRLIAVFPYFAYARQDNEFRVGEPVSCGIVAKIFENVGVTDFLTITSHVHRITGIKKWFPDIKAYDISGVTTLAEYVKNNIKSSQELVVFAPDSEGLTWATEMANFIGSGQASALEKERDVNTGEIKQKLIGEVDVRGKNILIVDDIVSTGKTIAQAANMLRRERGARKVAFAYVHPVHSPGAVELMKKQSPIFIATTDTMETSARGIEVVTVAGAVAKKVKEIL